MSPLKKNKLEQLEELGLIGALEERNWPEVNFGDRIKLKFYEVKMQKDCCSGPFANISASDGGISPIPEITIDLKEMVYKLVCDKIENLEDDIEIIRMAVHDIEDKLDAIFNFLSLKNE